MLIASARKVIVFDSVIRKSLLRDAWKPSNEGPRRPGKLYAVLPVVPGSGLTRMACPEELTTWKLVNRPAKVGSPPKLGCGAFVTESPGKYWTKPFPFCTCERLLGSWPTRFAVFCVR